MTTTDSQASARSRFPEGMHNMTAYQSVKSRGKTIGYIAKPRVDILGSMFGCEYWAAYRIKDGKAQRFGDAPGKVRARDMVKRDYAELQAK